MSEEERFERLASLTIEERERELADLERSDPMAARRLRRLLEGSERSHLLDRPPTPDELRQALDAPRSPVVSPSDDFVIDRTIEVLRLERPGAVIGPYELEEPLGEGGMGTVWVAKQREPVRRRVALKLIKQGMDSREILARFEHERQALAVMEHPNIAKVFDAGRTPSGHPYFAMELVNGLPLTKYCDEAKLSTPERLDLFAQICSAVQHAHQKGVIHRDLKPANILVTVIDGRPVPKVIDFGVAKVLAGNSIEGATMTRFGAVVGTLEYMAPEQAGYSGNDIDTRADIYALGVILYELLSGMKPFDGQRLRQAAIDEMLRIIREEEPSKPSTRLSSSDARPTIAAARRSDPAKLARLLRGDLDWIVLKCLEKDRNRRYETANQLAMEVRRYLADEPVLAGPPTAGYLLGKFLRRNRRQVTVAVGLLLSLAIGLIASLWQMNRAIRAERQAVAARNEEQRLRGEAEQERERAERNEAKAIAARRQAIESLDTVTGDVVRSLLSQSPRLTDEQLAFTDRVLKIYERLAEIDDDRRAGADLKTGGYWRITELQMRMGDYDSAERSLGRLLATLRERTIDPTRDLDTRVEIVWAMRNRAESLFHLGRQSEAIELTENALAEAEGIRRDFPDDSRSHAVVMAIRWDLARRLDELGPSETTVARLRRLLDDCRLALAEKPDDLEPRILMAEVSERMGIVLMKLERGEEAEQSLRQAADIVQELQGGKFPDVSRLQYDDDAIHRSLGDVLMQNDHPEEAVDAYTRSLEASQRRAARGEIRHFGGENLWQNRAASHQRRAKAYERLGRLSDGVQDLRSALADIERWRESVGDEPESIRLRAWWLDDLARMISSGGGSDDELIETLQTLADYRETHLELLEPQADYLRTIAAYRELAADLLTKQERYDEAAALLVRAGETRRRMLDEASEAERPEHRVAIAEGRRMLSLVLRSAKRAAEAEQELAKSLEMFDQLALELSGQAEQEAERDDVLQRAARTRHDDGDRLVSEKRLDEAIVRFTEALTTRDERLLARPDDLGRAEEVAWSRRNRGRVLLELRRTDEGIADFRAAVAAFDGIAPADDGRVGFLESLAHEYDQFSEGRLRTQRYLVEARRVFGEVRELRRRLCRERPESPRFVMQQAWSVHNLCQTLADEGKGEEAAAMGLEVEPIVEQLMAWPEADRETLLNLSDTVLKIGYRLSQIGQPEASLAIDDQLLALRSALSDRFPDDDDLHRLVAWAHQHRGTMLVVLQRNDEGSEAFRAAMMSSLEAMRVAKYSRASVLDADRLIAVTCTTLESAGLIRELVEFAEAYDRQVTELNDRSLPIDGEIIGLLGIGLYRLGRLTEADPTLERAIGLLEARDPNDWRAWYCRSLRGSVLLDLGRRDEATVLLTEGYRGVSDRRASINPKHIHRLQHAADLLKRLDDPNAASGEARGETNDDFGEEGPTEADRPTGEPPGAPKDRAPSPQSPREER